MDVFIITKFYAMPPPHVVLVWPVGFMIVLLFVGIFVTATRTRGKTSEQDRRAGLGIMAILIGPLLGAFVAWLGNIFGDVHPADVRDTYVVFTLLGSIAGLFAGIAFAITGLLSARNSSGNGMREKEVDVTDEL